MPPVADLHLLVRWTASGQAPTAAGPASSRIEVRHGAQPVLWQEWVSGELRSWSDAPISDVDLIVSIGSECGLATLLEPVSPLAWYRGVRYADPAAPERLVRYPWLPLDRDDHDEIAARPGGFRLTLGLHVMDFPGGVLHLFVDVAEDGSSRLRGPLGDGQAEVDIDLAARDLARWAGGRQSLPDLISRSTIRGDAFLMGVFSHLIEAPPATDRPPSMALIRSIEELLGSWAAALGGDGTEP